MCWGGGGGGTCTSKCQWQSFFSNRSGWVGLMLVPVLPIASGCHSSHTDGMGGFLCEPAFPDASDCHYSQTIGLRWLSV